MKYFMILSYDGTNFKGFQSQINERTVEEELNIALTRLFKEDVKVIGSGRTDAGVHAIGQTVHFSTTGFIDFESLKKFKNIEKL